MTVAHFWSGKLLIENISFGLSEEKSMPISHALAFSPRYGLQSHHHAEVVACSKAALVPAISTASMIRWEGSKNKPSYKLHQVLGSHERLRVREEIMSYGIGNGHREILQRCIDFCMLYHCNWLS